MKCEFKRFSDGSSKFIFVPETKEDEVFVKELDASLIHEYPAPFEKDITRLYSLGFSTVNKDELTIGRAR